MALLSRLLLAAHTCAFLGVSQAGAQELFGNLVLLGGQQDVRDDGVHGAGYMAGRI